ncbi:MAG TPA: hypothetical protein VHS09_06450 [Polyangiaceae bacterium]|jgi:hypothetical protein|nr:hypothetical protein [Polyangiaceae bacterium]
MTEATKDDTKERLSIVSAEIIDLAAARRRMAPRDETPRATRPAEVIDLAELLSRAIKAAGKPGPSRGAP